MAMTAGDWKRVMRLVEKRVAEVKVTRREFTLLQREVRRGGEVTRRGIRRLTVAQSRTERTVKRLAEDHKQLVRALKELAESQERTDETMRGVVEAQQRTEETVKGLVEAQQRTEENVAELQRTVKDLTEAQKRTDETMRGLVEAQRRTEETVKGLVEAQKRTDETVKGLVEEQKRTEENVAELQRTVKNLIEAQKRTEENVAELQRTVKDLTEAQKRTEETLRGLLEAQARMDHKLNSIAGMVGAMAETFGGEIEQIALQVVHDALERERGWEVETLRGIWERWDGQEVQVDVFGRARDPSQPGETFWIVGEAKHNLAAKDLEQLRRNVDLVSKQFGGRVVPVVFCYRIPGEIERGLPAQGILLVTASGRVQ